MHAADTGISNKARACLSRGLCKPSKICATPGLLRRASPRADIQAIPNGIALLGDVLLQSSIINDVHVINRMPNSYPVAWIALNIDHAQL